MVAFARLLEEDLGELEGEAAQDLAYLRSSADEGLDLLGALSAWIAAGGEPTREPVDLGALFRDAATELEAQRAAVEGAIEVGALPTRLVDRAAFARLARELLSNGLHYGHGEDGPAPRVSVRAAGEALIVEDRGPGIGPADLARVCEPLVRLVPRRRVPGHGLGLAIVARIAQVHGAGLELEAPPEGGLRVIVRWGGSA